jgi:hypothetical protein
MSLTDRTLAPSSTNMYLGAFGFPIGVRIMVGPKGVTGKQQVM